MTPPRDDLLKALDEAVRKVGAQSVLISDLVATRVRLEKRVEPDPVAEREAGEDAPGTFADGDTRSQNLVRKRRLRQSRHPLQ